MAWVDGCLICFESRWKNKHKHEDGRTKVAENKKGWKFIVPQKYYERERESWFLKRTRDSLTDFDTKHTPNKLNIEGGSSVLIIWLLCFRFFRLTSRSIKYVKGEEHKQKK